MLTARLDQYGYLLTPYIKLATCVERCIQLISLTVKTEILNCTPV